MEFYDEDISDLKLHFRKVQNKVFELKKQILYMETYFRRENVKVFGLPEELSTSNGGDRIHDGAQLPTEDSKKNYLQLFRRTPQDRPVPQQNRFSKSTSSSKTQQRCKTTSNYCKTFGLW